MPPAVGSGLVGSGLTSTPSPTHGRAAQQLRYLSVVGERHQGPLMVHKRELKDTVVRLLQQTENLKKLKKAEGGKEQDQADGILEENESLKAKLEKMEKRIQELEKERHKNGSKTKKVTIYTTKNRDAVEKEAILKEKIPKEPKSYAIVVSETEGEANEEPINKIKIGLQGIQSNKAIKQIRTSKEGKIVISLDKDDQAINDLSKAIENALDRAGSKSKGKKNTHRYYTSVDSTRQLLSTK